MKSGFWILLIALVPQAGDATAPVLRKGEAAQGTILEKDPTVETDALISSPHPVRPIRGKRYRFHVESPGPITIDLRSHFFDSYLVLRDAESNAVLAEDNDGLLFRHSRITWEVQEPAAFSLDVCSLSGGTGRYEVRWISGTPPSLTEAEKRAASIEQARKSLQLVEAEYGPSHPTTATSLNHLGILLREEGKFEEAKLLYQRAFAIRRETLGLEHFDTAASLNNLAMILKDLGDPSAAKPLYEQALAIWEKIAGPEDLNTAISLNNLAMTYQVLGDFDAARPLYERSLTIWQEVLGPEHPNTATTLNNLASVLWELGDFEGASRLFERALAIREKLSGPEHPQTAISLSNLANVHRDLGNFEQARALNERALAIFEKVQGPEHPHTAVALNNVGNLLRDLGDLEEARSLHERALAIREKTFGSVHPETASSLHNLAGLLEELGDLDQSRAYRERAAAIWEKVLGPEHPMTALGLNNMGGFLKATGDLDGATKHVERALSIYQKVLGSDHPTTALCIYNLGVAYKEGGHFEAARERFEQSLAIWERASGIQHPRTAVNLNSLALLMSDLGKHREAYALVQRAVHASELHRRQFLWSLTQSERLLFARTQQTAFHTLLSLSLILPEAKPETVYQTVLRWKGAVSRSLLQSRGSELARLTPEARHSVEELRRLQARISRELYRKEIKDRATHATNLDGLRERRSKLEREFSRALGPGEKETATLSELRAVLPSGSALVDFVIHPIYVNAVRRPDWTLERDGYWTEPRLTAWVLREGSNEVQRVDLGEARPVEEATRLFLETLVGARTATAARGVTRVSQVQEGTAKRANDSLRKLLWQPLEHHVGEADKLYISPDRFLGTLPLEVIQLEDGSYLVEHHAFVYLEDMASLVGIQKGRTERGTEGDLLSVGGVDYQKRKDTGDLSATREGRSPRAPRGLGFTWVDLPATRGESRGILDLHEKAFGDDCSRAMLEGAEANEERLKRELPRHRIVHLATHGFFQPEGIASMWEQVQGELGPRLVMREEERRITGLMPGLLSGLVLAGANRQHEGDGDDGLLTAEEISFLDLSGVDLVVLSACETGLGRAEGGEGMLGLRSTLRQAGAGTVVSSLWQVDDASTSELMRLFYEGLWIQGQGKLEALRGAQLKLLKQNRTEDRAALPSTWGAFVLDGDWR